MCGLMIDDRVSRRIEIEGRGEGGAPSSVGHALDFLRQRDQELEERLSALHGGTRVRCCARLDCLVRGNRNERERDIDDSWHDSCRYERERERD